MKRRVPLSATIAAVMTSAALELVTPGFLNENADTFSNPSLSPSVRWEFASGEAVAENGAIQFSARGEYGRYVTVTDSYDTPCEIAEVESELILGGWSDQLPEVPEDAQCSIAWLQDGLCIYSGDGWIPVSGAELLGDGRGRHTLFTRIDYSERMFTMKIDGVTLVDGNGNRFFPLVGTSNGVIGCGFAGGGAIYSVKSGSRGNDVYHFGQGDVRSICEKITDHPRLHVCGPAALAALRANKSPRAKLMRRRIAEAAEANLVKPLTVFGKDAADKRLTGDSTASGIIIVCAAAHAFTNDPRFAARARDEMLSVCAQGAENGWVPTHYLGVAEVLRGLAFGYDWLYHSLSESERAIIRQAIIDYGFNGMRYWSGWDSNANNWSHVCWQGVVAAALAIYENYAPNVPLLLNRCVNGLKAATAAYAPKGAYPEGPGYWNYGTRLFCQMLDQLDSVLGMTCGLYILPGVAETGEYLALMQGPTGKMFNYSDGNENIGSYFPARIYLARKARRADWVLNEARILDDDLRGANNIRGEDALWTLLWGDVLDSSATNQLPLVWYGEGENSVAVLRESHDEGAMFLGVKGGRANNSHGHMDVGSFVFDMDGERWASDLGAQNYASLESLGKGVIDLWNFNQDSTRWNVFRLGPFSHNLVTINGEKPNVVGEAMFYSAGNAALSVSSVRMNLSRTYASGLCSSAVRDFDFHRPDRTMTVCDKFRGVAVGANLRWAMATQAEVASIESNKVTLAQNGVKLAITMTSEIPGVWNAEEIGQGVNQWDCANIGYRMLTYSFTMPEGGDVVMSAEFASPVNQSSVHGRTFYGFDQGIAPSGKPVAYGSLRDAIAWWDYPSTQSRQVNAVSPWIGTAYNCKYEILTEGRTKVTSSGKFPNVPIAFGNDNKAMKLRTNGGIRLEIPNATVYGATFEANSSGALFLDGTFNFRASDSGITFRGSGVEDVDRGVTLGGNLIGDRNVTLNFDASFVTNFSASSTHIVSGDASRFKGVLRVKKAMPPGGVSSGRHLTMKLSSPSALGDVSYLRRDAVVLEDNTRLILGADVIQDEMRPRGITFDLGENEHACLHADFEEDWILREPVEAKCGTIVKTGNGCVTLANGYALPSLVVREGLLGIGSNVVVTAQSFTGAGGRRFPGLYGSRDACDAHPGVKEDASLTGFGVLRVLTGPLTATTIHIR